MAIFGWTIVILDLGRIVYPVNGITIIESQLPNYLSNTFGALHLSDLSLGVATVTLASLKSNLLRLSGVFVGLMQIIGSYYRFLIDKVIGIISILCWLVWIVIYSLVQIKIKHNHDVNF